MGAPPSASSNEILALQPVALADMHRRQHVGRQIYALWTRGGSNPSGLADPLFDGRLDLLGTYMTFQDNDSNFAALPVEQGAVDRVRDFQLSYNDFVVRYMQPNLPVIITGLADNWRATKAWTKIDNETGKAVPDLEYLADQFGDELVPVYAQAQAGFSPIRPVSHEMTFVGYYQWWREHQESSADELLYLKDWKFMASHPNYHAYEWPHYFRDDWLNQAMGNAYKFVYLGRKGTSTVLHADVLRSYSWSTNVCGRKRWSLVPPEFTYLLYDCFGKTLATHLHADLQGVILFPGLDKARQVALHVVQEPGETIFVPSNWFHTVENLEDTLSINHNWLNGYNLHHSIDHLCAEVAELAAHERPLGRGGSVFCGDNAQIVDDLVLLWQVVSQKLKQQELQDLDELDMQSVILVLGRLNELVATGTACHSIFGEESSHSLHLKAALEQAVNRSSLPHP